MELDLFLFEDYRTYLQKRLEHNPQRWGMVSRMAQAIGCQHSQLSRVLKGSVHLTPEQALGIARYWQFNEEETAYFLTLVDCARAGNQGLRQFHESRLQQMRKDRENIARRLNQPQLSATEQEVLYYSSWIWAAIHIVVSIPELQTPEAIACYLSLPLSQVNTCLETLARMGLIAQSAGNEYRFSSSSMHLPAESPLSSTSMGEWRRKAVEDSRLPYTRGLHYTVAQSISKKDFEKVKAQLLKFIGDYARIAGPSEPEDLICFSLDLFPVGEYRNSPPS